ncbi:hypothetical protein [Flagellimonas sp.]|uniref:hypothetical protein n=1 Tax=Flagellimonas sp. TaxID=2058762 RepID=UPI003F4A71E4
MTKTTLIAALLILFFTADVTAQELSVFSGFWAPEYYQDDVKIDRKEAKKLLLEYDESAVYWKKKATNEALFAGAYTISLGGAVWLGVELGRDRNGEDRDLLAPSLVTLGGLIFSTIFLDGANKNGKKAILTYNKQFDEKQTSFNWEPILNKDGLGFALKF